jgi:hypothetical protein
MCDPCCHARQHWPVWQLGHLVGLSAIDVGEDVVFHGNTAVCDSDVIASFQTILTSAEALSPRPFDGYW